MALFLLFIDGANETRYKIVEGLTIGRSEGDVLVPDPTVSTKHAIFKYSSKDKGWTIMDLSSRNGIMCDGRRVRSLPITHGVKFMIGKAYFKIIDIEDTVARPINSAKKDAVEEVSVATEVKPSWKEKIERLARGVERVVKNSPSSLSAFSPKISLKFVRGIQYPTEWTLGYGPREFGSDTPEHPLFEPDAPDTSFSLTPTTNGVVFKSFDSEKVLLNGRPTKTDIIKAGDEIEVLATKIIISFVK